MIRTIGCLSYMPLGYGTPQIQYLLRDLAAHYRVKIPIGVFAPRDEKHPDRDAQFPDFFIHHFSTTQGHKLALSTAVSDLVRYLQDNKIRRLGVYGAGTHTKALLDLWRTRQGPAIQTLITSDAPPEPVVAGVPVIPVSALEKGRLDLVILSSHCFEREMAEKLRAKRPELPLAAIYDGSLSRYPEGKPRPPETLLPPAYSDVRAQRAAAWLDAFRPDLLVCTHEMYLEAIVNARHQPRHIVYYAFELPGGTDGTAFRSSCWDEHAALAPRISLVLYPESARRRYYEQLFRWENLPAATIYNARPLKVSAPKPHAARNDRVLLQGSLGAEKNFINYLVQRSSRRPHIDVYGVLHSWNRDQDQARIILSDRHLATKHGFSYCGFLDNETMSRRRRNYAFVFVSWNPTSFDALHACPNKFFESIADGVPPIAAPHPQCREIIEKYDCGILLRDWSLSAFEEGLRQAQEMFGTKRYRELVANCRRAHETRLCWDKQFAIVLPLLPKAGRPRATAEARRPRFVLLDPTLRNEMGHHYHYAENVLSGARRLGCETIAAINRAFEVHLEEADRVHPVYWFDFWGRNVGVPGMPRGEQTSRHFVEQTKRVIEAEQLGPHDEVYVPNISDADLAALTTWLQQSRGRAGPRWHLFVRHDLPPDPRSRVASMRALGGADSPVRALFYTDTAELAEQHQRASGIAVTVLPIPVAAAPMARRPQRARRPWRVTYLGDARAEKGYDVLPEIVRGCADLVAAGQIAFHIQTAGSSAEAACQQATAELETLAVGPAIKLYPDRLSAEAYDALLAQADVILALYHGPTYARRSSHVVAEGLCSGKVVLTTRDSAPGRLLPAESPWLCGNAADAVAALRALVQPAGNGSRPGRWSLSARERAKLAAFHNGWRLAEMLTADRQVADAAVSVAAR